MIKTYFYPKIIICDNSQYPNFKNKKGINFKYYKFTNQWKIIRIYINNLTIDFNLIKEK